jgi:hypothetical protein
MQSFISSARRVVKIWTFITEIKALFLKTSPDRAHAAVAPKIFNWTETTTAFCCFFWNSKILSCFVKHSAAIFESTVNVASPAINSALADQFFLQTASLPIMLIAAFWNIDAGFSESDSAEVI